MLIFYITQHPCARFRFYLEKCNNSSQYGSHYETIASLVIATLTLSVAKGKQSSQNKFLFSLDCFVAFGSSQLTKIAVFSSDAMVSEVYCKGCSLAEIQQSECWRHPTRVRVDPEELIYEDVQNHKRNVTSPFQRDGEKKTSSPSDRVIVLPKQPKLIKHVTK